MRRTGRSRQAPDPGEGGTRLSPLWRLASGEVIIATMASRWRVRGFVLGAARGLAWAVAGALLLAVGLAFLMKPEGRLERWHREAPPGEFRARDSVRGVSFDEYLRREERLFATLDRYGVDAREGSPYSPFLRYARGGCDAPEAFGRDYNRTVEWPAASPKGGALLLHGLSDSPYSMRAVGEVLARRGYYVLALRLPGHGTVPAALNEVSWGDWAAAVEVGARRVRERAGKGPFLIVGYSAGGALAVHYTLSAPRRGLPSPDGLALLSPAIGVSSLAKVSLVPRVLGGLPGLESLAWFEVDPELDPFKYSSFPYRAVGEMRALAETVREELSQRPRSAPFPPILAFQSLADATVSARDVADTLFDRVAPPGSELVLVDLNRAAHLRGLLREDPATWVAPRMAAPTRPYRMTLLTNRGESSQVVARSTERTSTEVLERETGLSWPPAIFSLSHVAVPFPPDDPLCGEGPSPTPSGHLRFGSLAVKGEAGILFGSEAELMRLRYNPFFPELVARLEAFASALESASSGRAVRE